MATIYRFIVEQKTTETNSGRKAPSDATKGASKKGRYVSIIGGDRGGVEHNRKMRAINPLINRATGGAWEKGMRVGRAGLGLVQQNTETGKLRLSGPAVAIIIAFIIQAILKWQNREVQKAKEKNTQNYKQMENGIGAIRTQYQISTNLWNGRLTYNENK